VSRCARRKISQQESCIDDLETTTAGSTVSEFLLAKPSNDGAAKQRQRNQASRNDWVNDETAIRRDYGQQATVATVCDAVVKAQIVERN
jgi:hypothetical protein